ncbi:MAG: Ig domain-containing protein [Nitrososphaera sp.]
MLGALQLSSRTSLAMVLAGVLILSAFIAPVLSSRSAFAAENAKNAHPPAKTITHPTFGPILPIYNGMGAIIGNGHVIMGVDYAGQLNVPYRAINGTGWSLPTSDPGHPPIGYVGLRNGNGSFASTEPGCLCEGWGVAIPSNTIGDPNATGYANNAAGSANLVVNSFAGTDGGSSAVSNVTAFNKIVVTHDYHPTPLTPYLYQVTVSFKNNGTTDLNNVTYRRVMDWDIQPTQFAEVVGNHGVKANLEPTGRLVHSGDNGFLTSDPLQAIVPSDFQVDSGTYNQDYNYSGPDDHGGVFDLQVGPIKAGQTVAFNEYYGTAPNEALTKGALAAVNATLYSLGYNSEPVVNGTNVADVNGTYGPVFAWGFGGITGSVLDHPPTIDPIANQTVAVNSTATFTAVGHDSDVNDTLTYSLSGAPTGASINATTGAFSWKPNGSSGQTPGNYTFDVFVTDSHGLSAHTPVTITVTSAVTGSTASVTVIKKIEGGWATLDNFTLMLNGQPVTNGSATTVTAGQQQNISESFNPPSLESQYRTLFQGDCAPDGTISADKVKADASLQCVMINVFVKHHKHAEESLVCQDYNSTDINGKTIPTGKVIRCESFDNKSDVNGMRFMVKGPDGVMLDSGNQAYKSGEKIYITFMDNATGSYTVHIAYYDLDGHKITSKCDLYVHFTAATRVKGTA